MKQLGIRLSIDDFGTGYSSLAYLKRLRVDKIKIDQSFVRGLPEESESQAIAKALVQLCKSLNLTSIAEGIETWPQFEFLTTCGCEEGQGYLFAGPLPRDEMTHFLRQLATRVPLLPPQG